MSVPSMVHRSGDTLIVRSVVSGNALYGSEVDAEEDELVGAGAGLKGRCFSGNFYDNASVNGKDLPECKVKRNYSCGTCDFFTQNPRHYLYHLRDVHNEKVKIYECPNCLYASKHFQKLLRHTKMVHGTSDMAATQTLAEPTRPTRARKRSMEQQQQQPQEDSADEYSGDGMTATDDEKQPPVHKCSMCVFVGKTSAQLTKHERDEHIKTKFFRCNKCTYVTHMKARYTKHVKYHSMPMIKCDMCDFRTPYKWNLDRHCKNHNGRGAFRCSACNFTADIKQSLTVHEMNHHVPPVGQAAGLGVGRRRNKVGASDSTAAEDGIQVPPAEQHEYGDVLLRSTLQKTPPTTTTTTAAASSNSNNKVTSRTAASGHSISFARSREPETDFVHPDDIVHHSNGKVYIKTKCRFCSFKTPWESEMLRHEKQMHSDVILSPPPAKKKVARPVPDLLPIGQSPPPKDQRVRAGGEPVMSQLDMKKIIAGSKNSALKDFARLFGSEELMQQSGGSSSSPEQPKSFFDQFKDNLYDSKNLICEHCDFESKCLTMHTMHMKKCRGLAAASVNMVPLHKLSSTRCQYCRQRCKSSKDLLAHLMTCDEAQKVTRIKEEPLMMMEAAGAHDMYAEDDDMLLDKKPHPMEHKVFVWTKMEEDETNSSLKQYDDSDTDNRSQDNNQLPWDVRTQSPNSESSNSVSNNNNNNNNYDLAQLYTPAASLTPLLQHTPPLVAQTMSAAAAAASTTTTTPSGTTDKIPTHGNDISIAQHKRVFKCPHCTFWASTASRFHVHIVGHLNKKPFECSLCAYRSNWRWDITKHIKLKSVRDPAHESAKVLMTDETGRRNYTKYNKYLTEIHVNGGPEAQETSGGMGTRPRDKQKSGGGGSGGERPSTLRPPPQLKPADEYLNRVSASGGGSAGNNSSGHHGSVGGDKKRSSGDGKKTYWQCKKCNFRDLCKDKLLVHVRSHYPQASGGGGNGGSGGGGMSGTSPVSSPGGGGRYSGHASTSSLIGTSEGGSGVGGGTNGGELDSEASVAGGGMARGQAPFRCGHCHQVSNWKHVIQRHCRLKHGGDIKVIVGNKDNKDAFEVVNDDYMMEPVDVVQDGNLKCSHCPFSCNDAEDYQMHLEGHIPTAQAPIKCCYCNYYVAQHEDLYAHLKLHGVNALAIKEERIAQQAPTHEPEQSPSSSSSSSKRYKCATCPYVTNSKSQFTYHKQFHKPKNGQYNCKECSYNVSKRHLLHQHMKVHGITVSPQKQNGEVLDLEEISDEIEEVHSPTFDWQNLQEIPLVWVSKAGKFSKMYRCRFCPHVNLRKVNIMEHEKMHGNRERNSSRLGSENEHRCPECNYVCNNAGVLSSHNKVHQGLYGVVHGLVDSSKTDEEQIRELGAVPAAVNIAISLDDEIDYETPEIEMLHFCNKCPARFLKENEFSIHAKFHGANLQNRCDFCTYSSQQKAYLQAHSKVHTKEYQDRTRILVEASRINPENPPPVVTQTGDAWIVDDVSSDEEQDNGFGYKQRMNVPLSGTDLFLQKSEAEAHESGYAAAAAAISRNGKVKDKRFKCPKCPSAFEKRDQFKHHISLHGSNQQYTCTICDYSVNSYPSFLQHEKKHTSSIKLEDDIEEVDSAFMPPAKEATPDVKKPYWCSMCPYTNTRRDAVDNHQKRHVKLSGMESNYTCTMCDYSVPQLHFLREHAKLHFLPNKMHSPDAYLAQSAVEFAIRSDDDSEPTKYSLKNDVESSPLNNNEGEKVFVNTQTGELVESKKDVAADMDTS